MITVMRMLSAGDYRLYNNEGDAIASMTKTPGYPEWYGYRLDSAGCGIGPKEVAPSLTQLREKLEASLPEGEV